MRVAAVLPAYNEEQFIEEALRMLSREVFDDLIVVDDASSDSTAARAESLATAVVPHVTNRGVGAALVTGFRAALERGNDVAVVIPGDGQADLGALAPMLDAIADGYGLVISDRLSGRDASDWGMPGYRIFGSRVLAVLTWITTGLWIPDPQSGYQAIRAEALERMPLDELYPRWGIHNDVLSQCALRGVPVSTVRAEPVYTAPDGSPITSHIKLRDLIPRHARVFSRMLVRRLRAKVVPSSVAVAPWPYAVDGAGEGRTLGRTP